MTRARESPRLQLAAVLGLLCFVVLAGCSAEEAFVVPDQDEEGRYIVLLTANNTFEPDRVEVPVGATVVWRVEGGNHDVSESEGRWSSAEGREIDEQGYAELLGPGEEYERTFNGTETYTVWCHTHHEAGMKLVLRVAD